MVYLSTSDEWQRQSALLLQARPTTTRITTKYNIPNLNAPKRSKITKDRKSKQTPGTEAQAKETASTPKGPKAVLVLKTYDPESGVVLKFQTDRAAEVGRLITGLGRLGRHMAALPEKAVEDTVMEDAVSGTATPQAAALQPLAAVAGDVKAQAGSGGADGGANKKNKKKKGKK